jgi:hypothetical protein
MRIVFYCLFLVMISSCAAGGFNKGKSGHNHIPDAPCACGVELINLARNIG